MPLSKEHQSRSYPGEYEKTDIASPKKRVREFWWTRNFVSKGGSTPYLVLINGFSRRPPKPNLFFLASPNLEDEIHFKGGSL